MKTLSRSLIALMSAASCAAPAMAEGFSLTDVQMLCTEGAKADAVNDTGTEDEKLTTNRFAHCGTQSLGDNYRWLDFLHGDRVGSPGTGLGGDNATYQRSFVFMPRFSLSKLTGKSLELGPLQDVGLTSRLEIASYGNYRVTAPGMSLTWRAPCWACLVTAFYLHRSIFSGSHGLASVVRLAPLTTGGMTFNADGLLLVSCPDGLGTNVLLQPELRLALDIAGKIEDGSRIEHARYTACGTRDVQTMPNLMLRWNL